MDDVATVRPAATPFVARAAELERLRQLTLEASAGGAAAVLLAGDAGVGKTSLIAEAARRAIDDGLLVLFGRCVDLGTGSLPYLPFAEALSQLVRAGEAGTPTQTGNGQTGNGQTGNGQTGNGQTGNGQTGNGQTGNGQTGNGQTGNGQTGNGQTGNGQTGYEKIVKAAQIVRAAAEERSGLARIAGAGGQATLERGPGDTGLDRLALFEAVSQVLARIGDEVAPLLLVIEDLHWADSSTRDLVRFLLARLGGDRLLVVASYRADDLHRRHPLRPLLGELLRLPQVERMDLAPFEAAELADFLSAVHGGELDPEVLAQITARSAGNAYYAEELLAAGAAVQLPTGLADVLLDRLERLSPAGQQVVRMASVLGSARIEDALLRACTEADLKGADGLGIDVEAGLREAVTHQVLIPDGPDRYAFRHALLQEAVYADLLPGQRVRLHATAAQQLVALTGHDRQPADRTAAELARHALAAHDLPLALSASLRAAAEAGRRSAPAEALVHYEEALNLWSAVEAGRRPEGRDQVEIAIEAAAVAGDAGMHERAMSLAQAGIDDALAAGDRLATARARAALALHTYASGDMDTAREQGRRVVVDLDGTPPNAARVLARAIEVRVDISLSEVDAALEVFPAALAEAKQLGLLSLQADLQTTLATASGMAGLPGAEEHLTAAREVAERAGDRAALIRVFYVTAVDRVDSGDLAAAVEAATEGLAVAEASGLASSLYAAQTRSLLITIRWQMGDGEGALAVVRPDRQLSASLARRMELFALPVLAAQDPEQVLTVGSGMVVTQTDWHNQVLHTARAEALGWLGRWDDVAAAAAKAIAFVDADGEPYALVGISIATTGLAAMADAAARARERGDDAAVQRAIEQAEPLINQARQRAERGRPRRFTMGPEGLAWLARLDVETARLHGSDDEAAWGRVAEAFEGVSVYEAARARWRRAQLLARAGQRESARAVATQARQAAVRLGARPLIEALDDLARRGRFEVAKPTPADAVLTRRERDVMALVAEGLTNRAIGERLFIAEKTASVHVSNVLAKLGASGRAEAVAIVTRHGLLTP
jgi:DNA-binding CsgD family transcriptional regulator